MVPKAPKTSPGAPGSMLTQLPETWATRAFWRGPLQGTWLAISHV